jgi:hypothetical protein
MPSQSAVTDVFSAPMSTTRAVALLCEYLRFSRQSETSMRKYTTKHTLLIDQSWPRRKLARPNPPLQSQLSFVAPLWDSTPAHSSTAGTPAISSPALPPAPYPRPFLCLHSRLLCRSIRLLPELRSSLPVLDNSVRVVRVLYLHVGSREVDRIVAVQALAARQYAITRRNNGLWGVFASKSSACRVTARVEDQGTDLIWVGRLGMA